MAIANFNLRGIAPEVMIKLKHEAEKQDTSVNFLILKLIYNLIPIKLVNVELEESLLIADKLNIYAYDAYLITCALNSHCPLITLGNGLITVARNLGIKILEVEHDDDI